jgi:hypothetical protein
MKRVEGVPEVNAKHREMVGKIEVPAAGSRQNKKVALEQSRQRWCAEKESVDSLQDGDTL